MNQITYHFSVSVPSNITREAFLVGLLEYLNNLPQSELLDGPVVQEENIGSQLVCPHCGMPYYSKNESMTTNEMISFLDQSTVVHLLDQYVCNYCQTSFFEPVSEAFFHEELCSDEYECTYLMTIPKSYIDRIKEGLEKQNKSFVSVPFGRKFIRLDVNYDKQSITLNEVSLDDIQPYVRPLIYMDIKDIEDLVGKYLIEYEGNPNYGCLIIQTSTEKQEV